MASNFITAFDDTLPSVGSPSLIPTSGNAASNIPASVSSAVSGVAQSAVSGIASFFFSTRFVAIVLGLLLIFGGILLLAGDSLADAVKRVTPFTEA